MSETTAAQFDEFKEVARYWIKEFGLINWRVTFEHGEVGTDIGGECAWNNTGRIATITMATEREENPDIGRTAFHEVCELLLAPITSALLDEYGRSWTDVETHRIIRTLEHVVYEPWAKEREPLKEEAFALFYKHLTGLNLVPGAMTVVDGPLS